MSVTDNIKEGAYTAKHPDMSDSPSKEERSQRMSDYRAQVEIRRQRFKADAFEELGLANLPDEIKDQIFRKVWEDAHSDGLGNVLYELEEIADVLRATLDAYGINIRTARPGQEQSVEVGSDLDL